MISFDNVFLSFGKKNVISSFNFEFKEGETICVLGESGCGKSTLLKLAAGLLRPDSGNIIYNREIRKSFVFQEDRLLPWQNALENICFTGVKRDKAAEYLEIVGLGCELESRPESLSGGMKRRLVLARAFAHGGDFYFFDEALQGLDMTTALGIIELIKSELKGKSALIITHNAHEAFALADRIIIAKGLPFELKKDLKISDIENVDELAGLLI